MASVLRFFVRARNCGRTLLIGGLVLVGVASAQNQNPDSKSRGVRVGDMLARVAESGGLSFRLEPESLADRQIGLVGRGTVPSKRILPWVDAVLGTIGLVVEPIPGTRNVYRVAQADTAIPPRVRAPGEAGDSGARVVTRFPLRHVSAETAARMLRPFRLARPGAIEEGPDGRSLIVSGHPALVRRVERLLGFVDAGAAGRSRRFGTLRLENHSAAELADSLGALFTPADEVDAPVPRVSADHRTNAIAVCGDEDTVVGVLEIAALMDLEAHRPESRLRAYRLEHAEAESLVEALGDALGQRDAGRAGSNSSRSTSRPPGAAEGVGRGADPASSPSRSARSGRRNPGETGPRIVALLSQNAIIVSGTRREQEWIAGVVADLDRPRRTVHLDVVVADIARSDAERLGLELANQDPGGSVGHFFGTAFGFSSFVGGGIGVARREPALNFSGLATGVLGGSVGVPVLLRALSETRHSTVVTTFAAAVQEFGTARVSTTDQRPTIERLDTVRRDGPVSEPGSPLGADDRRRTERFREYENADTSLVVSPLRFDGEEIRLDLTVVLQAFGAASSDAALPPSRGDRRLTTRVTVRPGATVALGHLREVSRRRSRRGVPVLSDVPVVGELFSSQAEDEEERLLSFFLTVRGIDGAPPRSTRSSRRESDLRVRDGNAARSPREGGGPSSRRP